MAMASIAKISRAPAKVVPTGDNGQSLNEPGRVGVEGTQPSAVLEESTYNLLARRFAIALSSAAAIGILLFVSISLAWPRPFVDGANAWKAHVDSVQSLPDEAYRLDRFRAVRGRVTDPDGKPVAGALVQSIRIDAVVDLAKAGVRSAEDWKIPVEAEVRTDDDGSYEFKHLPIGVRTFCYSTREHGLASQTKDLIVVQDGLGARLDVILERAADLRVQLNFPAAESLRLHLIPYRWWPSLIAQNVASDETTATLDTLGGPFRKGLIMASGTDTASPWRVVGRYDVDTSSEATIDLSDGAEPTPIEVDAAAGLESWSKTHTEAERLFWAVISPVAIFWDVPVTNQPFVPFLARTGPQRSTAGAGAVHGFGPSPFLPVLLEGRSGQATLGWTTVASEFELTTLPQDLYHVRAWNSFGRVTFSRGTIVYPNVVSNVATGLGSMVDRELPNSREVMGFVRWDNGKPAQKALVYMQHSQNFRRFLRRVECDEYGYFIITDVPGEEPYFIFALPANDANAVKNFDGLPVASTHREVWHDLTLYAGRILGHVARCKSRCTLRIVSADSDDQRVGWTIETDDTGRFEISNVPRGRYLARRMESVTGRLQDSLPFVVGDDPQVVIRWGDEVTSPDDAN